MNKEQFIAWIEGYMSLSSERQLTTQQLTTILNHAKLVKVINKNTDEYIDKLIISLSQLKLKNENSSRELLHKLICCS